MDFNQYDKAKGHKGQGVVESYDRPRPKSIRQIEDHGKISQEDYKIWPGKS